MKNKILILVVFAIILVSFFLPNWLFQMEDLKSESQIFAIEKPKSKIDVQAEKIYLVKAIHDINESYRNVKISKKEPVYYGDDIYVESELAIAMTNASEIQNQEAVCHNLKSELEKLESANILKDLNWETDFVEYDLQTRNFIYSNEYTIKQSILKNDAYELHIEIEDKTRKILYLLFPKDKIEMEIGLEEVLRNYVQYLDLYIIDDWKFENDTLRSEKAQLIVCLIQREEYYLLSVQSMTKYERYYEVVESAK